ncbi:zinc finger and BTB domain-containing protein 8A-like [Dermacentor silvarum]|uniref:zinc finger and BTB domain-containing protein 8A-like n=1 Tax=Dermacentor silvarum TaxID=543639 RepID=UPI002100BFCB|nr:zinc finger and BTB domain-containing protein 8A-like [Dermacentor silvarum]
MELGLYEEEEEEEIDTDNTDEEEPLEEPLEEFGFTTATGGDSPYLSHLSPNQTLSALSVPAHQQRQPHVEPSPEASFETSEPSHEFGYDLESSMRSPLKRIVCPICLHTFANKANFKRHQLLHWPVRRKFPCFLCPKQFNWPDDVKRHIRSVHQLNVDPKGRKQPPPSMAL